MKSRDQIDNETIMLGIVGGLIHTAGLALVIEDVIVEGHDPHLVIRSPALKSAYRLRVELIPDTAEGE